MSPLLASLLAAIAAITLWVIAAVHAYWAFGGAWPASERSALPQMVVGSEDERMPPMGITLIVAMLIAIAGLLPLAWTGWLPLLIGQKLVRLALWGLVVVFMGRGLVTYTPIAQSVFAVEPFNTLNRKYYSPLCIALGSIFLALVLAGSS